MGPTVTLTAYQNPFLLSGQTKMICVRRKMRQLLGSGRPAGAAESKPPYCVADASLRRAAGTAALEKKRPHCWGHSLKRRIGRESGKANAWRRSASQNEQREMWTTKRGTHVSGLFVACELCTCQTKMGRNPPRITSISNLLMGSDLRLQICAALRLRYGKLCRNMLQECAHN